MTYKFINVQTYQIVENFAPHVQDNKICINNNFIFLMCLKKYKQFKNKYFSNSMRIYCIFNVFMNENFFTVQPNQCLQIAILNL